MANRYRSTALVGIISVIFTYVHTDDQELCQTETFRAECGEKDRVIFINSALYGRMRIGRCVRTDYGHVGCSGDVMDHTDRRCSGKRRCNINIPDAVFDKAETNCPVDFKSYFQVNYTCIKAEMPRNKPCDPEKPQYIQLSSSSGYLANVITERDDYGSLKCPWRITVQRGQRINVTLFDFTTPTAGIRHDILDSKICYQYAIITEKSRANGSKKICGGSVRERTVYTSRSHSIEIRIITRRNVETEKEYYFLLKYSAIGCPRPKPPAHGWVERSSNGVIMGCNHSDWSWPMYCEGTQWVGALLNCSAHVRGAEVNSSGAMLLWGSISLPYSVSVVIIGGLAGIFGFIILLVALICAEWQKVKRSRRLEKARFTELQQRRDDGSSIRSGSAKGDHDEFHQQRLSTYISETGTLKGPHKSSTSDQNSKERDKEKDHWKDKSKEDDYAYVREMWPMAPPPGNLFDDTLFDGHIEDPEPTSPIFGCDSMELTQVDEFSPEEEFTQAHIYETPRPLRRNRADPQYFELDSKGTLPRSTLPLRHKPAAVVGLDDDYTMDNRRS